MGAYFSRHSEILKCRDTIEVFFFPTGIGSKFVFTKDWSNNDNEKELYPRMVGDTFSYYFCLFFTRVQSR